MLLSAAVECFRRLGAKSVLIGEGPGYQRDTELVLLESGFTDELRQLRVPFVDLNRDELVMTPLLATYTGMNCLWLARTVLEADFVVSMPKVKTHHWSGVTLSMKNMFGVVPAAKYGWPKNILHWKGIQESILDVCATVPVHFVIARITHIRIGAQFLGNASTERIDQVAEAVCAPANPFDVAPEFQHLRVTDSAQRDF